MAKIGTYTSYTTWWPNLEPIQVVKFLTTLSLQIWHLGTNWEPIGNKLGLNWEQIGIELKKTNWD